MDKNARNLVIVESPNKTQTLTKIFKDAGYKDTFVVASYGHIAEILTGTGYKQTGIEPDDDFKAKYAVMLDKKQKVEEIKLQVEKADHIYICSGLAWWTYMRDGSSSLPRTIHRNSHPYLS